jgi:hypothetical protein
MGSLVDRETIKNVKFMKNRNFIVGKNTRRLALACAVLAAACGGATGLARAQDASTTVSPGLQQVVNLSKAGMSDDFIQTYITNSGRNYGLSVNDIIYLHQQGVSDNVIKALMQPPSAANLNSAPANPVPTATVNPGDSAPAAAPPAPPPVDASVMSQDSAPNAVPAAPPTLDYFQTQLSPYGNWLNVAGYGQCWQPTMNPGWRPYYDGGHWVYTDSGWYWQSDYPWGDIPFHYGRWIFTTAGWAWVPGYDYAPAWVVWRQADADGYVGWAPLPPGAVFVGGGWTFNGIAVGVGFGFGLGASYFTFVDYGHFWVHDYRTCVVPRDRLGLIYQRSRCDNRFREDHGRFFNEGLDRNRVAEYSHHYIQPEREQDLRREGEQRHQEDFHNVNHGSNPGWSGGNHDGNHGPNGYQPQTPAPNHNQSGGNHQHQSWNGGQQPGQNTVQNGGQHWNQGQNVRQPQMQTPNNIVVENKNNNFNHNPSGLNQPNLNWNPGQQQVHATFQQNGGQNWNEGRNVRPPQQTYNPPPTTYHYVPASSGNNPPPHYQSVGAPTSVVMREPAPHAVPSAPRVSQSSGGGGHAGGGRSGTN